MEEDRRDPGPASSSGGALVVGAAGVTAHGPSGRVIGVGSPRQASPW